MAYRYGFKAEAERLAVDVRGDLRLGQYRRLDPLLLAADLEIPVWPLARFVVDAPAELRSAVELLHTAESSALSAFTVFRGSKRVVVHNDAHPPGRQSNNVMHELSHGLLLHPPTPALDRSGCREWNADVEDEADYLAGALLIPAKAAWWIAKSRTSFEHAAEQFGCSVDLVRWRVNVTGARRLLAG